ncbi:hypothetical protein L1987_74556 [Smallanthus sonchifolius]|uniref:Uncharacterized protein n=1 Tax=Smallanthus sonchifolius TaxID=185202 RepID=A0ACB9A398_9ASTR|nr:hypothetical protein L1987_74556 [Smallanthus sonchifolius]
MGDWKLKFNVARFTLEEGEIRKPPDAETNRKEKRAETGFRGSFYWPKSGTSSMSYRDVVSEDRNNRHEGKFVTVSDEVMAFSDLHGKAIMARLKDLDALHRIRETLADMDIGVYKVQYMGGLMVLISFTDEISEVGFKEEAMKRLDAFDMVRVWVLEEAGERFPDLLDQFSDETSADSDKAGEDTVVEQMDCLNKEDDTVQIPVKGLGSSPGSSAVNRPISDTSIGQELPSEDPLISANHGDISNNVERSPDLGHVPNLHGSTKILEKEKVLFVGGEKNKRKKHNRFNHVGRPNEEYVSSNERPTKEKRGSNEDPFGIDGFIWTQENNEEMEKSDLQILKEKSLGRIESSNMRDVDCSKTEPGGIQVEEMFVEDDSRPSEILAISEDQRETQNAQGVPTDCVNQEVIKTVSLGVMLGAQLQNFQDMVREAVHQEGLQLDREGFTFCTYRLSLESVLFFEGFVSSTTIGLGVENGR